MEARTITATVATTPNVNHFKSGVIDFMAGSFGKDHSIYTYNLNDSTHDAMQKLYILNFV